MKPRRPSPPLSDADGLAGLSEWYETPLGKAYENVELSSVREVISTLFGFHLLLVSPPWGASPLGASRIGHRIVMPRTPHATAGLVGAAQALPISTDALDVVILPHTLEFVERPHEVLREVDRCLIPEGHVLILGFNPYGLWGLWRLLYGWRRRAPWTGRFISQTRVRDWLALLGFDTVACTPLFFRPPLQGGFALQRLEVLDRLARRGWPIPAAGYQLLARKRVVGLTPIRPRWRPRRSLLGGLVEPSRRDRLS